MKNDQNFVMFVSFIVVTGAICGWIAIFLHIFGEKGQHWIDDSEYLMVSQMYGSGEIQQHDCQLLPAYHGTGTVGYVRKCPNK